MFNMDMDNDMELNDDMVDAVHLEGNENKKIPFQFNLEVLDLFCEFVTNVDSQQISRAALTNMETMMNITDMKLYANNSNLMARMDFVKFILEARIELGLEKKSLIIGHAVRMVDENLKKILKDEIVPLVEQSQMSNQMINYINNMVYENLVHGYTLVYSEKIMDLFEKRDNGFYKRISDFSKDFKALMSELGDEIRASENYLTDKKSFDLSPNNFKNAIHDVLKKLKAPSNKLKSGIKFLDRMISGGFESGRIYSFMGLPGSGKSVILLSIANWIRKYNKGVAKDPTKRATVLYITQENTYEETIERLFNMTVTGRDIREFSQEEVEQLLKEKAGLSLDNDGDVDLDIRYYNEKEIGPSDVYGIIDDLESQGKEVIALVYDYIERMKPAKQYQDLRHELGALTNELRVLGITKDIPVITASQMNRDAGKVAEQSVITQKKDFVKLFGKQHVAESWSMIKNLDVGVIIGRYTNDIEGEEKEYMAFNIAKLRGKPAKGAVGYFVHPFADDNGIMLLDDQNLNTSLSKFSIRDFENPLTKDDKIDKPLSITGQSMVSSFMDGLGDPFSTKNSFKESLKKIDELDRKFKKRREKEEKFSKDRAKMKKDKSTWLWVDEDGNIPISRKDTLLKDRDGNFMITRDKVKSKSA